MNKLTAQITTTSINKETTTMNTTTTTTCKPVDSQALSNMIRHIAKCVSTQGTYTTKEKYTMTMNQRAMSALHTILWNDHCGNYDPRSINKDEPFAWLATSTDTDVAPEAPVTTIDKQEGPEAAIKELRGWMAKTQAAGRSWAKLAREYGCKVVVDDGLIHVSIHFTPGDKDAYKRHSDNIRGLMSAIPCTQAGSTWGNDGVGAMIAEEKGYIDVAKGGVSKRFAAGAR